MSTFKRLTFNDIALEAEIRTVIVMFIKIDLHGMDIWVEDPSMIAERFCKDSNYFGFLSRSPNELQYDNSLLSNIQSCLTLLTSTFVKLGGHMRQFIVDDKGTPRPV